MRLTPRFVATVLLFAAFSVPASAQTRTRRIAEFAYGRQTVRVATVDGAVRVDAASTVEGVAVVASPGEA